MTELNYRLAVLTHGPDSDSHVARALAAFREHVTPMPEAITIHRDSGLGFCGATAKLWAAMVETGNEYVFWLEHDFLVARPVDLRDLAAVLEAEPKLAQLALMRDAYSDEEKAAGGLFEYRTRLGDYRTRRHYVYEDDLDAGDQMGREVGQHPWLEQSFFTTNPSLMRRDFMAAHPFPDDGEPHCEGRFSIALREQCWSFGTWGEGSVYVNHIGRRDGSGHGY